jgi:hypothetical protein
MPFVVLRPFEIIFILEYGIASRGFKLTENQVKEYIKCRKNPIYFLKTYGKVRHPTKGLLAFDLWEFQEECVKSFLNQSYNVILKARQLGLSTLSAGYAAWMMLFFSNKEIYILATKRDTATNLVDKIRVFLDNLPPWMRPKILTDNRQSIRLENGSNVKASGTTQDAARSEALSLLIVDEAAFVRGMNDIWVAAQPTLSTGGDCIALSTPNGVGNWFHKQYSDAEAGVKHEVGGKMIGFNPIKLHWSMHPDRDDKWAEAELKKIGVRAFAQEHDADFLQSGNNVIDYQDLMWYIENEEIMKGGDPQSFIRDPEEKIGFDKGLWIWKHPDYSRNYLISADVARGDGSDYSACQVFDVEANEQVAEYKGKVPTDVFAHLLVQIAVQYNNALLAVENNGPGWATIQKIIDLNYQNIYWTDKTRVFVDAGNSTQVYDPYDKSTKNMIPGFTTSSRTRPTIIARMEEDIRNKDVILHSQRLLTEFQTFIYNEGNGKAEHADGYNDDLIMSLAIGMFVRGTNLRIHQAGGDMQRVLLNNVSFSNNPYEYGVISPDKAKEEGAKHESWFMKAGEHEEDITWLR